MSHRTDLGLSQDRYICMICTTWLTLRGGYCVICMIYSRTCSLGCICTVQILHNHLITAQDLRDLDRDLSADDLSDLVIFSFEVFVVCFFLLYHYLSGSVEWCMLWSGGHEVRPSLPTQAHRDSSNNSSSLVDCFFSFVNWRLLTLRITRGRSLRCSQMPTHACVVSVVIALNSASSKKERDTFRSLINVLCGTI